MNELKTHTKPNTKESLFSIGEHFYVLETQRFTVTVNYNGGMLPVILNEGITPENLPDEFVKIFREPNMSSLWDAILAGNDQALMFGKILPRGTHLRIK